ncbi:hypothetical protein PTKIN_Ptkin16aG0537100 [Pterospermum kingtungense]
MPEEKYISNVKRVLRCFQAASGLKIYFRKSKLFGIGIDQNMVNVWAGFIGCEGDSLPSTYLSLPLGIRTNSIAAWKPVVDNFEKKLSGWKANCLSFSGRTTLVKSVLGCLPSYFMSIFLMPRSVKEKLDRIQRRFLWGEDGNKKKLHLVGWNQVCAPKVFSGIGLVDLELKNRALLNKWIWRYAEDEKSLWRRVVDGCYGGSNNDLIPRMSNHTRFSSVCRDITKPLVVSDDYLQFFMLGIGFLLGDGKRILFWHHEWIPWIILKYKFPRIFALVISKDATVSECGEFIDGNWCWNLTLRRRLFGWEESWWVALMDLIKNYSVCNSIKDSIVWRYDSIGRYMAKSFCLSFLQSKMQTCSWWKEVWAGLAPPKVEALCWQILLGKVAVKVELKKRGISQVTDEVCVFCWSECETVLHLFFHCNVSRKVWEAWLFRWRISWCFPSDPVTFMLSWNFATLHCDSSLIWRMGFFAIIWTLWLHRNEILFNAGSLRVDEIIDLSILRPALWSEAKWPNMSVGVSEIIRNPELAVVYQRNRSIQCSASWMRTEFGCLKFNVDGSSLGKPGPAGIGGLLRDHEGRVKIRFSKAIGMADSNLAEILAIKEAFVLFAESQWARSHKLIVESDSSDAVSWSNHPTNAPWAMRRYINQIECLKGNIRGWEVVHVRRACNSAADSLAKEAVFRVEELVDVSLTKLVRMKWQF